MGVPSEAVTIIPHGVSAAAWTDDAAARSEARRSMHLSYDQPVAAFVGRLEPQKNPLWLVDVAAATAALDPPPRVVVMGGGPLEDAMRQAAAERGVSQRLTFLPYSDPLRVYRAMDLLLLPSQHEGFALVAAEAMMVGRPVLRTDTAGGAEQVVNDDVGRLTPVDRDAFVAAAAELLARPGRLAAMGRAAHAHASANLTLERQVGADGGAVPTHLKNVRRRRIGVG